MIKLEIKSFAIISPLIFTKEINNCLCFSFFSPASQNIAGFLNTIAFHRVGVKISKLTFVKHFKVRGVLLDDSEKVERK